MATGLYSHPQTNTGQQFLPGLRCVLTLHLHVLTGQKWPVKRLRSVPQTLHGNALQKQRSGKTLLLWPGASVFLQAERHHARCSQRLHGDKDAVWPPLGLLRPQGGRHRHAHGLRGRCAQQACALPAHDSQSSRCSAGAIHLLRPSQ